MRLPTALDHARGGIGGRAGLRPQVGVAFPVGVVVRRAPHFADRRVDLLPMIQPLRIALLPHFRSTFLGNCLGAQSMQPQHHLSGLFRVLMRHGGSLSGGETCWKGICDRGFLAASRTRVTRMKFRSSLQRRREVPHSGRRALGRLNLVHRLRRSVNGPPAGRC